MTFLVVHTLLYALHTFAQQNRKVRGILRIVEASDLKRNVFQTPNNPPSLGPESDLVEH